MPEPTKQQKNLIRRLWREHESQLSGDTYPDILRMVPVTNTAEASRLIRLLMALPTPPEVLEHQQRYITPLLDEIDAMEGWELTFANSVIKQHNDGKRLSQKQLDAIRRIAKLTIRAD